MMAAYVTGPGPAEEIRYGLLPVPTPGPTDVLVKVLAVAVNPVDTFVRSGTYRTPMPAPFIVGRDLVGVVVAGGSGVSGFAPGDRVWCNSLGHAGRQGAAAEYAVVAADRLYPLPAGVDPVDAVAVLHPAATAYLALFRHARLQPGETVYVAGGGGNVGTALIELAARAGARVVASARDDDHERCRARGAAAVVDYRAADLTERLRLHAPHGVDVHIDTSGHNDLTAAVGLLAPRGRIVLIAGRDATPPLPVGDLYTRDASIVGFAISNTSTGDLAAAAARINQLLATGALTPTTVQTLPLSAAAKAHRLVEDGAAHGQRLVLCPAEEPAVTSR
ncbi:NADPH:quinone reductase [Planosporangium thailandense]|uniref:NADPH:quinone reductase n=2 Tax=Planosporangium thailandense TaxID=765197 RepID=A0ABX0Y198_9ACTN|nr:NADPH:quinone reductase [Planosporangium thailandense]